MAPSSSLALAAPTSADQPPQSRPGQALTLLRLLDATAARHATRPAFRDQPNREAWTGRPRFEWSYELAGEVVRRLAAFLGGLGLRPGSPVGVYLPGGSEALLTILALEQSGLVPCLLPATWTEPELTAAVELIGLQGIVTQGRLGEDRPAERICAVAARCYGLRFLCAFGPDVPDGVFDLDPAMLADGAAPEPEPAEAPGGGGFITFVSGVDPLRAVRRSTKSLVASAAAFLAASMIKPGDRILSLVPPDDHAGLATGLAAAVVSGATLECHGLFEAASLARSLDEPLRTHLIAPGWLEPALAESGLTEGCASTILVHRPPVRFQAKMPLLENVVDLLALGEAAAVASARDGAGRMALALRSPDALAGTGSDLLELRCEEDGAILLRGLAADVHNFARAPAGTSSDRPEWRDSGYKAELFAGMLIAVS